MKIIYTLLISTMKPVICPHCQCQCWDSDYLYHHIGDKHRNLENKENLELKNEEHPNSSMNVITLPGLRSWCAIPILFILAIPLMSSYSTSVLPSLFMRF